MPTAVRHQNEDTEMLEVPEDAMFRREGFDRPGIRRELANVTAISLDTIEIEREPREFVDPRTVDMPFGPTEFGETGGSGVEEIRVDGRDWRTVRYANGVEYNSEEQPNDLSMQSDAILETFDFLADANFLKGVYDRRNDVQIREGVFDFMKGNIPSDRTIDCDDFDNDGSGNEAGNPDYSDTPENVIKYEAYSRISGDLLSREDPNWDVAIARQESLAKLNRVTQTNSGRTTYRALLNSGDAKGGISSELLIPSELRLHNVPAGHNLESDELTIDLTTELGADEMILIPDLDVAQRRWMRLAEMPSPEIFETDLRMGRGAIDMVWRYSHQFDPYDTYPNLKDAVHLQNVSDLFGGA